MKTPPPEATKTVYPILRQIVNLIPPNIVMRRESAYLSPRPGRIRDCIWRVRLMADGDADVLRG